MGLFRLTTDHFRPFRGLADGDLTGGFPRACCESADQSGGRE